MIDFVSFVVWVVIALFLFSCLVWVALGRAIERHDMKEKYQRLQESMAYEKVLCKDCRFVSRKEVSHETRLHIFYECHRCGPVETEQEWGWPIVAENDWCGEGKRK